ncbi:4-hydroxy-2-oxoglutarate aldolase, mitochondrial 2 [Phlyctema vagabunda]|uniref:4-hydroxy-2-oxoglutarate aldolase, mitochondrial 2 n=1 Tax=Phlyctema vagabunda TaxID=108571 RepID=A0ABR4PQW7_9HELO
MSAPLPHIPKAGIWCPAVTLYKDDQLDLEAQAKYFAYLASTGLTGLVILGTNAEAFLLTSGERKSLIATARRAVGPSFPLMAGCGAHSTAQTLENIQDAAEAGATYVLVLPPAYFGKATTPKVVRSFFADVATQSPLPIVIYNFPGVCNGVDLDSDLIAELGREHANIVGVKLTCGSVGKITRLGASFTPAEFSTFGGQSDFLIGGLSVGSAGCIAAFANVFPKIVVKIYDLYKAGKYQEALELHGKAAIAESCCKLGIAATKYAAALTSGKAAGIDDIVERMVPRRPYEAPSADVKKIVESSLKDLLDVELAL